MKLAKRGSHGAEVRKENLCALCVLCGEKYFKDSTNVDWAEVRSPTSVVEHRYRSAQPTILRVRCGEIFLY